MIKSFIRKPIRNFKPLFIEIAKLGYTLYKNNDTRGKYFIAKNYTQYNGGDNTPRFFNTMSEIERDWLING